MRKFLSLLLTVVVLMCGCDRSEARTDIPEENKIETVFPDENVVAYDLAPDGSVCFLTNDETGEFDEFEIPGGEIIKEPLYELNFTRVSPNGEREKYSLGSENAPMDMCADGSNIYYSAFVLENYVENISLFKYSLTDGSKEKLHAFQNLTFVKKTVFIDNKIFTLGTDPSKIGIGETGDDYFNGGEVLSCFDLETKTESIIWETGAVEFGFSDNKLVIYAHDTDGYFIITYDISTGDYSEKKRCDLGMIYAFAMCGDDRYIYAGSETFTNNSCATMGSLNYDGKLDIILGETDFSGKVKYSNGKICYLDCGMQSETAGRLICADISAALKSDLSKFLKLASSQHLSQAPSSLGFSLISERLEPEEFALTVLSQDQSYDLFLFTSQEEFSYNVKSKGSFYPLNDTDGVMDYLKDCFPFIRDAMIDENGDIWALPIAIRADTICYNGEVSNSLGLGFSENMTPDEFISAMSTAQSNGLTYDVSPNLYSDLLIRDYLNRYELFDTPDFRELAEWIKTQIFKNRDIFSSGSSYGAATSTGQFGKIDFDMIGYPSDFALYSKISSNHIVRTPNFSDNNQVICTFICVNPSSENLRDALNYISLLSRTLHEDENNLCAVNSSIYTGSEFYSELKTVLDNGTIRFRCPNEVYAASFSSYINGGITLDEFITEADRKLSAYLNE